MLNKNSTIWVLPNGQYTINPRGAKERVGIYAGINVTTDAIIVQKPDGTQIEIPCRDIEQ